MYFVELYKHWILIEKAVKIGWQTVTDSCRQHLQDRLLSRDSVEVRYHYTLTCKDGMKSKSQPVDGRSRRWEKKCVWWGASRTFCSPKSVKLRKFTHSSFATGHYGDITMIISAATISLVGNFGMIDMSKLWIKYTFKKQQQQQKNKKTKQTKNKQKPCSSFLKRMFSMNYIS